MRRTLLTTAAMLGFGLGPALAQNTTSSTMSPPSPNASVGTPEPTNALPSGAGTATRMMGGNTVATTGAAPAPVPYGAQDMTGMRPMRGQMRHPATAGSYGHAMPAYSGPATDDTTASLDAPRSGRYQGGVGSPRSSSASNITPADTRSGIAPRLPNPDAATNTPQSYLQAAQRALASGRTGAAQEALERAETRLLSRSTDPAMASAPADMPMVQQISQARRALATRDLVGARSAIDAAMSSGG